MTLKHPLGPGAVHVAIDMQRLFAEATEWCVPSIPEIAPQVLALARARPARTLFTRFVVPPSAGAAPGRWQIYYRRWADFTGERLPPEMLDLTADFAALASPTLTIDKLTYSAFESPDFEARLKALGADTLVVTGVETDVCVLATVLTAVDRGYHVVAVADALASSSPAGHRATLDHVLPRLDQQIEIADTATVLSAWK